jgi:hypothetical protein
VNPAGHAQAFADALLGDHGEALGDLRLSRTIIPRGDQGPRTQLISATPEALTSAALGFADAHHIVGVYVGVGLTRGYTAVNPATGRPYNRLAKADVCGLAWLWIDIDVAGPGHDSKMPLAVDQAQAIAVAQSTGLVPTVLVNTGHGVQVHWRLVEPFIYGAVDVTDDGAPVVDPARIAADRATGERLAYEWVKSLQIRGKRDFGIHVDPTTDPSRLIRLPGSYNRKVEGEHLLVEVLDVDASRRYDLDQIRAVLAPDDLLARTRYDGEVTGSLAGVDLHTLWASARSYPQHEPHWLVEAIECGWSPELAEIWSGARDAQYDNDESSIDMALVTTVLHLGLSPADAAEAVMCRRLKRNSKLDKVDPSRRQSYLDVTIGKVVAQMRENERVVTSRVGSTAAVVEAVMASVGAASPVVEVVAPVVDTPPEQDPAELTPTADPTDADNEPTPSLRIAPPPPGDPRDHADPELPPAPRPGLDGTLPAPVAESKRNAADRLAGSLGLPEGVGIWQVGYRRLADRDEFRLWLHRAPGSVVLGDHWPVGTVAATRWRPKGDWRARAMVAELLLEDLHLVVEVHREWANGANGRHRLYELAVRMREGTPEDVAGMAIQGVLRRLTATALFSTASTYGDPWLHDGVVWVPLVRIRDEYRQLGAQAPKMVEMVDLLVDMRCKVVAGMSEPEANRTVVDERQWVRVAEDLVHADLAALIAARAADRDAQDARHDMKGVGS